MADHVPPDQEDLLQPPEDVRPTRSARGAVLLGARILRGLVGCALAVLVLAATALLPLPRLEASTPSSLVTPVAADQQKLCAGPLLRLGDASGQGATVPSSFGSPTVLSGSGDGELRQGQLRSTDDSAGVAPPMLTLPAENAAADFAGSQVQVAAAGELAGLAAAGCADGSGETWLVGGSTETGRTTLITLGNPGEVSSTVSLEIFAEDGEVLAAGTEGIIVPAGSQRVVSLAAFAPGVASPVVRVTSRGGLIVANLQQTVVRTLTPGGVDIVSAAAAPAELAVLPGVLIGNAEGVASVVASAAGSEDATPVLRLYAPGGQEVAVEIAAIPEDGVTTASTAEVTVPAGKVADFPLTAFADGAYTLVVSGGSALVAAVRVPALGSAGQIDLAWLPAVRELAETTFMVVAPGPAPMLHLANPGSTPVEASLSSPAGSTTVSLPAGTAIAIPVSATEYRLDGAAGLRAAVVYLGDGQVAGFPVAPPAPVSRPIRVYAG